jgi:AcrR family transcriptional regulator
MDEPVRLKRRRSAHPPASRPEPTRSNDPERTMANILDVAMAEFGEKGLDGARIDAIADATATSKRMIYYYFGSKEGLYLAVLEASYRRVRETEAALHLESLDPERALRTLVGFTFDHHLRNEPYIRLVMSENMQSGQYLGCRPSGNCTNGASPPAYSAPDWTRWTFTLRSRRCRSSTSPTGTPSA